MRLRKLSNNKAKAALALSNSYKVLSGDDRVKLDALYSHLGATYVDPTITDSTIDTRVTDLESAVGTDLEDRVQFLEDRDVQLFDSDSMEVSDVTVANTAAETTLFSAIIPAGFITTPTMIELELDGVYNTANSSDTFTVRVKCNSTTVHSFNSVAKNVTDSPIQLSNKTTIRSVGVSGSTISKALFAAYNDSLFGASTASSTIDTTIANTIAVTMQWNSANADNYGILQQGILKISKNQG